MRTDVAFLFLGETLLIPHLYPVLEALVERGVDRILELGPGTALADMVRGAYPAMQVRAVDDFRSIAGIKAWIDR